MGQDAVATNFDLPSGEQANVVLEGSLASGSAFVDLAAIASAASGTVVSQEVVSDPANGIGIHKAGFE